MRKGKILYVRSGPYELSFDSYNLQEVGLGKAFCSLGYDFDIVYYTKKKERIQNIYTAENHLRILWTRGVKILRSGLYPKILKKQFLTNYDIVIVSEYSQIMSFLISKKHKNTYIYNGPYYNLFKIPFVEKLYDLLLVKSLNKNVKSFFCKTLMSKYYLEGKGIHNCTVVGVGLDPDKFESEKIIEPETLALLNKMNEKKNILYVGQIIPRKNVDLIIRAYLSVREKNSDCQLVLVGSGDSEYKKQCEALIPESYKDSIVWCSFIKNAQLKYVYKMASVFVLPSSKEIFGMVLLEAMYFGVPVISSHSAGADTLIVDNINGLIIDSFDSALWSQSIMNILSCQNKAKSFGNSASNTIKQGYMWLSIASKMEKEFI